MVDRVQGIGTNPIGDIPPASSDTTKVSKSNDVVWHSLDKIKKDNVISASEMGVEEDLQKILEELPKSVSTTAGSNAKRDIENIVNRLLMKNVDLSKLDHDAASKEVAMIKKDVAALKEIVKLLKKDEEIGTHEFRKLKLNSETSKKAVDPKHNAEAEMYKALEKAVDLAMKNGGTVDETQIPIETTEDLEILNIDTSAKFKLATGTDNDSRTTEGIFRSADAIVVTITYRYGDTTYEIKSRTDRTPDGYQANYVEPRELSITERKNDEKKFD